MGLINVGRNEGSQIIQLFGRGVRLKGKGFGLKRSNALHDDEHPEHLVELETLNVFGIRADYMDTFREYIDEEGVVKESEKEVIVLPTIENLARTDLKVILPKKDKPEFKRTTTLALEKKRMRGLVTADWYGHLSSLQSRYRLTDRDDDAPFQEYHTIRQVLDGPGDTYNAQFLRNLRTEYLASIDRSRDQLITDLNVIKGKLECGELAEYNAYNVELFNFANHLYRPLIHVAKGELKVTVKPTALNKHETKFCKDLEQWVEKEKAGWLREKELYLLRNQSRGKGVSFFAEGGFYPDFILWIVDRGHQRIRFLDPHGLRLQDIERRRNDDAFLDALGAQRIPDPNTSGDFTRRFGERDILKLMERRPRYEIATRPRRKRERVKEEVVRMEFRRFLHSLILLPVQIVRSGRRILFRILGYNEWLKDLFATWERLRCMHFP